MNQRQRGFIKVISIVVIALIIVGIFWFFSKTASKIPEDLQPNTQQVVSDARNVSNDTQNTNPASQNGEQLATSISLQPGSRVNAMQPVIITGKARAVFGEGEFDVSVSYILDNHKKVIASTFATCNLTGNGCDWISGNFVDFKAILDLSSAPVCHVNVEFFKRNDRDPQKQPFYTLPLWLYGNGSCL